MTAGSSDEPMTMRDPLHPIAWIAAAAISVAAAVGPALADDAASNPTPDLTIYDLFNPTPDSALRTFSPDRPARASSPITVDAGRFQVESDFLNYASTNRQGASTSTFEAADPVVKLGINSFTDFEIGFAGFVDTRTTRNLDGTTLSKGSGFGDVTLATKFNLLGNAGGTYGFALIPYLIVPSGTRNVSSGGVEGGVIAPFTVSLPSDFNLTLQAEIDALRNSDNPGTHTAFTNIVNVSHPVPGIKDLTATVELYSSVITERHTPDVYTFDTALAYLVQPDLQLDIGANIGLNHGAPDYQVYSGVAHRF